MVKRNNHWNFVLSMLYSIIIISSLYFAFTLDHWSSLIFGFVGGGFTGWLSNKVNYGK